MQLYQLLTNVTSIIKNIQIEVDFWRCTFDFYFKLEYIFGLKILLFFGKEVIYPLEDTLPYDYQSLMHATKQILPNVHIDPRQPIITRNDGGTGINF